MNWSYKTSIASAVSALLFLLAMAAPAAAQESFRTESLQIETRDGKVHEFLVELALDDGQRQQGLMNRKSMEVGRGMLFDFGRDREVTMWMKNTLLPLDMLFISKEGRVTHVNENAVPHSESIISSRGAVRYVLELNGGAYKKFGMSLGDTVRSKQIGNAR
jgi:uncharacterized membrane protein (UPF0127 family)